MKYIYAPKTMSIRVASFFAKQLTAEVAKRNFFKPDGHGNENEFFNKMLPNMLAYRAYKKGFLREYLDKNIKASIAEGMQEKILDFLAESFDYLYFDESEYECDDIINIRFDTKNEDLYAKLFSRLDNIGIKRSAYLRNLIHEYFNQSEYQRERICFNDEYNEIVEAMSNEMVFQCKVGENIVTALAAALEYSVKREHWYLLYFKENQFNTLYSVPLFEVKNILPRYKSEVVPNETVSEQVKEIIENGTFDSSDKFVLGGVSNA
jgi:hypothetical protein